MSGAQTDVPIIIIFRKQHPTADGSSQFNEEGDECPFRSVSIVEFAHPNDSPVRLERNHVYREFIARNDLLGKRRVRRANHALSEA